MLTRSEMCIRDRYNPSYVENLMAYTKNAKRPLIFFTDYAEIRDGNIVESTKLLRIKRIMLFLSLIHIFPSFKSSLNLGVSCGVEMIRISLIPALIRTESG